MGCLLAVLIAVVVLANLGAIIDGTLWALVLVAVSLENAAKRLFGVKRDHVAPPRERATGDELPRSEPPPR
jgi:hypothetical protein